MTKYLKLYLKFLNIAVQDQLAYKPLWALFSFLAHSAYILLSYIFLDVIITGFNLQYSRTELLAFLSFFHAVKGLYWIVCSININFIAYQAFNTNQMDFMLIKPLNHLWLVSTYKPNLFAFTDLIGGFIASFYFFNQLNVLSSLALLLFLLIAVPISSLLLYGIWFTYLFLIAPHGEKSGFTNNVLNITWVYGQYPSTVYSGLAKLLATVLFPTIIITTIPVFTLMRRSPIVLWLVVPFAACVTMFLAHLTWHRALKYYNSAN